MPLLSTPLRLPTPARQSGGACVSTATPPSSYDRLTALAQRLFDAPVAFVAFTERDRLVFASACGFEGRDIAREGSLCEMTLRADDLLILEDTHADPAASLSPLVAGPPHIRFYAGAPLRTPDGFAVGTFCIASDVPRVLSDDERRTFLDFVAMASCEVELQHEVSQHAQTTTLLRTALQDASHQLEHIAEAFVSIDPRWMITYANPQALRATGLAWHELVGRNVWERFPGATDTLFYAEMHRAMREQVPIIVEDRYGEAGRCFRMKAVPHRKGLSVLLSDITERRRAEEALRSSEARFRRLIEHLSDVLCVLDGDGLITFVSPSCTTLFGSEPDRFLSTPLLAYVHPDDLDEAARALERCAATAGVAPPLDIRWVRLDGTYVHLEVIANNLLDEPAIHGIVLTARDATERRRALETLHRSLEREREVNELRSSFVAMASHEFRTPLATILSSAQLATRFLGHSAEKTEKHLRRIGTTVHDMLALLDDILALERTGVEESHDVQVLDLPLLLAELFDELQVGLGAEHELHLTGTVPPSMQADRTTLRLVLSNLLTNAIKYSAAGSEVVLDVSCPEPGAPVVVFRVTDHGIGIPAHEQALLFEPFHRADNVGTIQGTGLGLSMVKQAVDRCGGTIFVQSDVGVGTTVEVLLPLAARPPRPSHP